jgi:hypothetical protein
VFFSVCQSFSASFSPGPASLILGMENLCYSSVIYRFLQCPSLVLTSCYVLVLKLHLNSLVMVDLELPMLKSCS